MEHEAWMGTGTLVWVVSLTVDANGSPPKPSLPAIRASFSLGLSLSLSSGSLRFPSVTETSTQLAPCNRVKVPRDSPAPLPRLHDRSLLAGLMSVRKHAALASFSLVSHLHSLESVARW
jgi:hypothetical protein